MLLDHAQPVLSRAIVPRRVAVGLGEDSAPVAWCWIEHWKEQVFMTISGYTELD
jgi:hypothetical protein